MATITVQTLSRSGAVPTYAAATSSDKFFNTGKEWVEVINGDSSSTTVTITSVGGCDQGFTHNETVTVAAGATKKIGPFPVARFNDDSGFVTIAFSNITSVTRGVFKAS